MKSLKMICTLTLLLVALSVPGHGGEINTPGFRAEEAPIIFQPSPQPEDNSGSVQLSSQSSELETAVLTAILLALSALF